MKNLLWLVAMLALAGRLPAQVASFPATLSDAEKIYGLSKFWQEVNYNFAFFHQVPDLNWDSAYTAFVPRVLATRNDYEYYRELQRFCALLEDGHTNVYFPKGVDSLLYGNSFGPISTSSRRFRITWRAGT